MGFIYNMFYYTSSYFRHLELAARWLNSKKHITRPHPKEIKVNTEKFIIKEEFCTAIKKYGIEEGDILIVHSSIDGLSALQIPPEEIINTLIDILGPSGTLCMPGFPLYRKKNKVTDNRGNEAFIYDAKNTLCWTGMLPNILLGYDGAIRSDNPTNPLIAYGKYANDMMDGNLEGKVPHGKGTCWDYCMQKHAKVLFLGISDIGHSFTELHLYEDNYPGFKINNWYRKSQYRITKWNNDRVIVELFERDIMWAKYITEAYCERKLCKDKMLLKESIKGVVSIGYVSDIYELYHYLCKYDVKHTPIYKIPKRYLK